MHELSLAEALVEQVEEILKKEQAVQVMSYTVVIGALSGVERDAFEFAMPVAAEHSMLQGATMIIEETPVTVHCKACGMNTHPDIFLMRCMHCGSKDFSVVGGREFLIKSLEFVKE